jgi:hypothetical protein
MLAVFEAIPRIGVEHPKTPQQIVKMGKNPHFSSNLILLTPFLLPRKLPPTSRGVVSSENCRSRLLQKGFKAEVPRRPQGLCHALFWQATRKA